MKTLLAASRLPVFLTVLWTVAAMSSPVLAVSNTFTGTPPPGYPASGALRQAPRVQATRQSAAAIQPPAVSYPSYPPNYPPPPGFTYPPPPQRSAVPVKKTPSKPKSTSKASSSKRTAAGPPPPPQHKVYGPTGDLSTQVSKLKDSDKVQNLRIGELERDVSSIKRGKSARYDGGTDLAAHTTYIARPGDTLFHIASTHRVSVGEIQQLNRMTGESEVHVGQALLIPSPHRLGSQTVQVSYKPSTPGGTPASTSTHVAPASSYHTVRKGDSLKAIAIKHNTTIATLVSANKLKNPNKIMVGQRLRIPGRVTNVAAAKPPAPVYRESSDTVPLPGFGTAATSTPQSPPAAGLTPAPAPIPPAPVKPAVTNDSHRGILAYRMDRTDTIESIAQHFSTTPEHIREINRLNAATQLKPGDEIMVPAMGAVSVSSR